MNTYTFDGYTLTMQETGRLHKYGQELIEYEFKNPKGETLFKGDDFGASPLYDDATGIQSAKALLGFLTLRKGDTDEEFFADYTPAQLEFSESLDCENLQIYCDEEYTEE